MDVWNISNVKVMIESFSKTMLIFKILSAVEMENIACVAEVIELW